MSDDHIVRCHVTTLTALKSHIDKKFGAMEEKFSEIINQKFYV